MTSSAKYFISFLIILLSMPGLATAQPLENRIGHYAFERDPLPKVQIFYALPEDFTPDMPVLVVIPGARRNADEYRDAWAPLAEEYGFAVMTLECTLNNCPTEYEYNSGGVTNAHGQMKPEAEWLFSVIDPAFEDFKSRTGSTQFKYALYGHSAGGSFVHMFMLFKADAKVSKAVSANAAFFAMPHTGEDYPFGLKNTNSTKKDIRRWLNAHLTIMLADQDTGPRTKNLSNGPIANAQGPSVYARGLLFMHNGLLAAKQLDMEMQWKLEVVHGVGHNNTKMAPHAIPFLFDPAQLQAAP